MFIESLAVLVAQRNGITILQNKPAQRLLGAGTGECCWDIFASLNDAQGLPCHPGCVLKLLAGGMDRSLNHRCKINGQCYSLNCIPVNDIAVITLSCVVSLLPHIWQVLTPRERDVLELLAAGETTPSAANTLGISKSTVQTHVETMRSKFGVNTQAAVVANGFRLGYLD